MNQTPTRNGAWPHFLGFVGLMNQTPTRNKMGQVSTFNGLTFAWGQVSTFYWFDTYYVGA